MVHDGSEQPKTYPFHMTGVRHVYFKDARQVFQLTADRIRIAPRRFGIFNVSAVNELLIDDLKIIVNDDEQMETLSREDTNFTVFDHVIHAASDQIKSMGGKTFGLITRQIINKLFIQIHKTDTTILQIGAEKALVTKKHKIVKLVTFSISRNKPFKTLTSNRAFWDRQRRCFLIPGNYKVITDHGVDVGQGARVNMNFEITPQ